MSIQKRLSQIEYQIKKGLSFTDEELVEKARDLYDSAINSGTYIDLATVFPSTSLGVSIQWSGTKKEFVVERGLVILYDDLTDELRPGVSSVSDVNNIMATNNNDYLILSSGQLLELSVEEGIKRLP